MLCFSYPLVLYPAHIIIESVLYRGWPKSKKRQWSKNLTRSLLVAITVLLTLLVYDDINGLLALNGSLFCTPVAFGFPALFHLKVCANDTKNKVIDISILVFSAFVMVFCTINSIINWGAA